MTQFTVVASHGFLRTWTPPGVGKFVRWQLRAWLPPFASPTFACFTAATTGFARGFWREESCHELWDIRQFMVGIQHVHWLLHLLQEEKVPGMRGILPGSTWIICMYEEHTNKRVLLSKIRLKDQNISIRHIKVIMHFNCVTSKAHKKTKIAQERH